MVKVMVLTGCATTLSNHHKTTESDYKKMSIATDINLEQLKSKCKEIECSYDKLKNKFQVNVSDENFGKSFISGGLETRTIDMAWVNGWDFVSTTVYSAGRYVGHEFFKYAEVYVKTEMVAKLDTNSNSKTGSYDKTYGYETIRTVNGTMSINSAIKIANAQYTDVTIRFYSNDGYIDVPLQREHNLSKLTQLIALSKEKY